MKLIDKDAVLAKIEKLKGKISDSSSYCNGWQHALRMLELSLDTLEVKEVDLEQEIKLNYNPADGLEFEEYKRITKYYFELGLKSKGE